MTDTKIRIADWKADNKLLTAIRRKVFITEQKVPEALEWDDADATSIHFLVMQNNRAIACARLTRAGQIGRMAVLPEFRDQGIGSKLLEYVIHTAAQNNFVELFLHAQQSAIGFYEKHGFIACGDIFYEASIPHRLMQMKF